MKSSNPKIDSTRRNFLVSSSGIAAGAVTCLGGAIAPAAQAAPPQCASDKSSDGFHGGFGSLRLALFGDDARQTAVPVIINAPDARASIDLSGNTPRIRIGVGSSAVLLEPKGVRLNADRSPRRWSEASVAALLAELASSPTHLSDLFALRTAAFALYPEYLARTSKTSSKSLAQSQARSGSQIAGFGRKRREDNCKLENVVEETTRTVRRTVDVILTAAERYAACSDRCDRRFLDRGDLIGFGVCEAECLESGFVDLVVGTIELVETVVETVTRQVLICVDRPLKDHLIDPFRGRFDARPHAGLLAGATGVQAAIPADVLPKAIDVLVKMVKSLPAAIQCVATGEWSITQLQAVGVDVAGVGQVPLGVTVCMDHECAMKLIGAGLGAEAFSIISSLIALASGGGVAGAVAAAGITGAAAAIVVQVVLAMLAVLIVMLVHLMIVAGQIVMYESFGMIEQGICITHPSLPVILAGVANPLLGLLALGNMPLVVTPRS
jgi:hypothetical protein